MASHSEDVLSYYLLLDKGREDELAPWRGWSNLSMGYEGGSLWLTGFTEAQMESTEVKIVPFTQRFYGLNGKLYPLHKQLPEREIPALLWTPLVLALPLESPVYNNNFFGIHEKLQLEIVHSTQEREPLAMRTTIAEVQTFLVDAPAVRLAGLVWTAFNNNEAFIVGSPVLSMPGEVFWFDNGIFIPSGFELNYAMLSKEIYDWLVPSQNYWLIWNTNQTYHKVEKSKFGKFSRGSFKDSCVKYALS